MHKLILYYFLNNNLKGNIKDVFYELEAFHLHDKQLVKFGVTDCAFGYRESVFKQKYKNQFAAVERKE